MDVLTNPLVFWTLVYIAFGCFVERTLFKGYTTVFSWVSGVVLWLPILLLGTILGIYQFYSGK